MSKNMYGPKKGMNNYDSNHKSSSAVTRAEQ